MKIVNRGFLIVRPKQAFCDWAKTQDPDFIFDEEDEVEQGPAEHEQVGNWAFARRALM